MNLRTEIAERMKVAGHGGAVISQSEMSRATGVTQASISRFLAGKKSLNAESVEAIIAFLRGEKIKWRK